MMVGLDLTTPHMVADTEQTGDLDSVAAKDASRLDELLKRFDPARHCGEVLAFHPVGVEVV
jgi:hypothetical protein